MAANHVLLERIVTSSSVASIVLDNIPQTGYTDLLIKISGRTVRTEIQDGLYMVLNGVNSTGFRNIEGNGATATSVASASYGVNWVGYINSANSTANTFSNHEIYITGYNSTKSKSIISDSTLENNATTAYHALTTSIWDYSASVTSISFGCNANFTANTTVSLYGVAALGTEPTIAPLASGGDVVANDGTYWYHAFLSSDIFTPVKALSCDVLVVAGGGGGSSAGGGGGAGGLLAFTSQSLAQANNYAVTVGAGGAGAYEDKGTNGSNSRFGSLTVAVGGGAGGTDYISGLAPESGNLGGSGGGGAMNPTAGGIAGLGTVGQGNNGGVGSTSGAAYGGGGGGGAGAVGGSGNGSVGGNGGAGVSTYSSWGVATNTGQNVSGTYWFAGGGAGSTNSGGSGTPTGGNGGGGNGGFGTAQPGVAGLTNTGGGGGSSSGGAAGGTSAAGGSGIVIVRYPMSS